MARGGKPTVDRDKLIRAFVEFYDVAIEDCHNLLEVGIVCKGVAQLLESPKRLSDSRVCFDESFKGPDAIGSNLQVHPR